MSSPSPFSKDEEISKLYANLPKDNPPPHVDEEVLKFAKKNMSPRTHRWLHFWAWSLPVALTASLFFLLQPKKEVTQEAPMQVAQVSPVPAPKVEDSFHNSAPAPAPAKQAAKKKDIAHSNRLPQVEKPARFGSQSNIEMEDKEPSRQSVAFAKGSNRAQGPFLPFLMTEACESLPFLSQVTSCNVEGTLPTGLMLQLQLEISDGGSARFEEEFEAWLRSMNFMLQAPNDYMRLLPNARERLQVERAKERVKLRWTFERID